MALLAVLHLHTLLPPELDYWVIQLFGFIPHRYDTTLLASPYPGGTEAMVWSFVTYSLLHANLSVAVGDHLADRNAGRRNQHFRSDLLGDPQPFQHGRPFRRFERDAVSACKTSGNKADLVRGRGHSSIHRI